MNAARTKCSTEISTLDLRFSIYVETTHKMYRLLFLLPFFLAASPIHASEEYLMEEFQSYAFSGDGYDVSIELDKVAEDKLAPKITFTEEGWKGTTGIGKDSAYAVIPGKWAVVFVAPYELWVYDGGDKVVLHERTIEPSGFRAVSSLKRPSLLKRAPKGLLDRLSESAPAKVENTATDSPE